jgi:DNA-binding helix-hairpin-helix protein with protein kinase domain
MIYTGLHNEQYVTGREVCRGGEGCVYDLQSHQGMVLKQYNEELTATRTAKLAHMVQMRTPAIEAYSAWPADLVCNSRGQVCGFVMRKLTGYVPLHNVFGPMDRKKLFPDKGYNFLVHVARNLATAFHNLHEAGLIIGDVNEGNILVSASGIAAFIDCDSFQVKNGSQYYYCEVGVPRYTPPELLKKSTFDQTIRTTNTDNFSLAVLIFQLLFLGRHPFAGKHRSAADIDEETAIRQHQFAYSLENKKKKLSPPPDSFGITNLPDNVVTLFHRAFEQDERPSAAEWIKALDGLLADMVTCQLSKLHTYPGQLESCPWCVFRKEKGIMYFLDDSYMQANSALGNIEQFINGFKPEQPVIRKIDPVAGLPVLTPAAPARKFVRASRARRWISFYWCILGAGFVLVNPVVTIVCLLAAGYVYKLSGWVKILSKERAARSASYFQLRNQLNNLLREYESPPDMVLHQKGIEKLQSLIAEFRRLPDELERRRKKMEEVLYNEQLDDYLWQFDLESNAIPTIGKAKKSALYNHGIRNAAQITKLATTKVPGIGPALEQVLLAWRRQMSTGFVYIPDTYKMNIAQQKVNEEVRQVKYQLETHIRKEYQSLNFLKMNIQNRAEILAVQIADLTLKVRQAEVNMDAFKKLAA